VAVVAVKDLAAERSRATGLDVRQGAVVTRQKPLVELLPVLCPVAPDDVRHFEQPNDLSGARNARGLRDPW